MINFVCVLRKDPATKRNKSIYDKEWVNKLYRAIKRNYDRPFKFFCLSNIDTDVETIPLETEWKGWWSKIELFRPGLFQGPVLYLDLDVVICNNITCFADDLSKDNFYMIKEPDGNVNSSLMYWCGDYSNIFKKFTENSLMFQEKYKKGKNLGDQGFIQDTVDYKIIQNSIQFKSHKIMTTEFTNPNFLIFISEHQKPSNNLNMDLVKENWI